MQRFTNTGAMPPPILEEYQISWIYALPIKAATTQEILNKSFGPLDEQDNMDTNIYTLGYIGKHYIVITCMGAPYSITSATTMANHIIQTFSQLLQISLIMGIRGGIPSATHNIQLGDIVISYPTGSCGGILQHDIGKINENRKHTRTSSLNSPPRLLLAVVNQIREIPRGPRKNNNPQPHYSIIVLGNIVIKYGSIQEQLRQETGTLCFKIKAIGLMQDFPWAAFNLYVNKDDKCLPGTRYKLLNQIKNGMAGTGKSTISWTISPSFFFKRGKEDQESAKKFFPTLTRQLMLWSSGLKPSIALKSLQEQFEKLFLQPLHRLDWRSQHSQNAELKSFYLRVFLTSRPELSISLGFSEIGNHVYQDTALHEIPEEYQFTKIQYFKKLVRISVPLFISAATEPKSCLTELLKDQAKYVSKMDKTYLPILTRLLDDQENNKREQQQFLQDILSNKDQPVRILHLSFPEFLAQTITKFHRDICNLADPRIYRIEINPLDIHKYLPLELQYSYYYWMYHLKNSQALSSDIEEMEAISLLGLILDIIGILDILQTIVTDHKVNPSLATFLHDTKQFIYQFPQVYKNWSAELQTLEGYTSLVMSMAFSPNGQLLGHTGLVMSIAFSPDSQLLASSSSNKTI
ncbi:WD40 repeat domain-containing protein [Aspergillus lucknowensis]|uniref:Nucleoside phosphorylase domain-containing protein n=1 Tax=Aspergillus lucknowensis TaxID=176173 RepID=A0ABR4LHV7_9EURO